MIRENICSFDSGSSESISLHRLGPEFDTTCPRLQVGEFVTL